MKWIKNNDRRPPKDGWYFTEDTEGAQDQTHFYNGSWHSKSGHPVYKWIDETTTNDVLIALQSLHEAVPAQSNDQDWWGDDLRRAMEKADEVITAYLV